MPILIILKTRYGKDLISMPMQSCRMKHTPYKRVSAVKTIWDEPVNEWGPVVEDTSDIGKRKTVF
jgi:hypothetical protein